MTQHEIVAGIANLHAIHEEANVVRIGVFSALVQAIMDGVKTGITAVFAIMDAFMHLRGLMFVNVRHGIPLL